MYDAIIIGGGVIGCAIARYLSMYQGKFLVLERHNDVGEETTNANSGIVHSGYDPLPGTLKAKFNVLGCKMMEQVSNELDVPFIKNGSLTIGFNDEDLKILEELLKRAKTNGVDAKIINKDELNKMEPNLNQSCKFA
ncbi:MAG TPA: FAD/NAD(P)-binding oxidoreductase, partial [Firmicutes bacterium]|nr:FAD/NAD(P)-binding oxidoreductase [Bacillota bacterium]